LVCKKFNALSFDDIYVMVEWSLVLFQSFREFLFFDLNQFLKLFDK
jgi:hypothetical protein